MFFLFGLQIRLYPLKHLHFYEIMGDFVLKLVQYRHILKAKKTEDMTNEGYTNALKKRAFDVERGPSSLIIYTMGLQTPL